MQTINPVNAATGLLIIEAVMSNINGDPDRESDPRTVDSLNGEFGLVSDVSIKRKVRDIVLAKDGPLWLQISKNAGVDDSDTEGFDILERPDRDRAEIAGMKPDAFKKKFWDARVFGSNFLEAGKDAINHTYAGPIAFSWGKTLAPVNIIRATTTNISPVQEGKSRGMAPLSYRVVEHAVYAVPFVYSPHNARKTGCAKRDLDLLLHALPHISLLVSRTRPQIIVRHVWWAQHDSPLGSCQPSLVWEALTPRATCDGPSHSWSDYEDPKAPELRGLTISDYASAAYAASA